MSQSNAAVANNAPEQQPLECSRAELLPILRTAKSFLVLLACWFLFQTSLRVLISPTANLDEAEQLMLTQSWAWGYGPQPPLYTWLQAAIFEVAGVSILSLALFKNALLLCTYCLAYLCARQITASHRAGVVAAMSLFLIPQFAWESQRDLTHSVLASTLALGALFCLLKCNEQRSWRWYLLLGLVLGCGSLAKYNFLLWAAGLLMAAASMTTFRKCIGNWRMATAIGLAVVITLPHANWALRNRDEVTRTASKFEIANSPDAKVQQGSGQTAARLVQSRVEGVWKMTWAATRFAAPLLAVHGLFIWLRRRAMPATLDPHPETTLILRAFGIIAVMLLLAILIFAATGFKDRWFQPILVALPVFLAARYRAAWSGPSPRWLWRLCATVMLVVAVLIPGRLMFAGWTGRTDRLNLPVPELGNLLAAQVQPSTIVVAESTFLAGNLRLSMPRHRVVSRDWGGAAAGPRCIVWDAREQANPPANLVRLGEPGTANLVENVFLEAAVRNEPGKKYRLGAYIDHQSGN